MKIKPVILVLFLVLGSVFLFTKVSRAVIINQIKIAALGTGKSTQEYIELYNPSSVPVLLANWQLYKFTKNSTSTNDKILLINLPEGVVIPATGYFLIAHNDYLPSGTNDIPDLTYSEESLASDNTVFLVSNSGVEDLVGYGAATAFEGSAPAANPGTRALVRDSFMDTNNNISDFFLSSEAPFNSSYLNTSNPTSTPIETTSTPIVGKILINEFLPYPEAGNEWIEFYNPNDFAINLNNWQLFDGVGSIYTVTSTISAQGFLVVNLSSSKLNNSGDLLVLKNSDGEIVDQVCYGVWEDFCTGENAVAPKKGNSLARSVESVDTGNDEVDFKETIELTPEATNIIEAPATAAGGGSASFYSGYTPYDKIGFGEVQLNEIYPNPSGADEVEEFIELKNYTNKVLDLGGLYLKDESGAKYIIPSGVISENGLLVFKRQTTHLSLNNSGSETVYLYSPDNLILDKISYTGPVEEGESYAKNSEADWQWTKVPTPEAENIFNNEEEEVVEVVSTSIPILVSSTLTEVPTVEEKTLKNVKAQTGSTTNKKVVYYRPVGLAEVGNLEVGDSIKIQGVVSVLPGVFSSQYFYLSSGEAGLQIYMYSKDFPQLQIGDLVEARGELSYPYGLWRLKIKNKSDLKIIQHNQPIEPIQVSLADLEENYLGSLIKVEGEITELKSGYLYLDDGSDEIRVVFKKGVNLERNGLVVGSEILVFGILSSGKTGFELWPRSGTDLQPIATNTVAVAESNEQIKNYLEVTAGGVFSILLGFVARARARFVWDGGAKVIKMAVNLFKRGPKV